MDMVIMGGNVLTMDSRDSRAEAVALEGGKIKTIGANAEVSKLIGPDTKVVHLAGRTLMPGFVDPHNHFSLTTFQPVSVDCSVPPHTSISSILDAISAAAKGAPKGRWLWGWGFRSRLLKDERRITRWELDEVAPDNPVCIMDGSVHACYANSAALKLASIDKNTPDPAHGQILHDDSGEPDGTLWEAAMNPVYNLSIQDYIDYYGDEVADLVQQNCMRHLACGITSVGDALVVPDAAKLYRIAESQKKLPMLIHQMLGGEGFFAPPEKASKGEYGDGNVSDRLRGGTMKIFMDPVFPSAAFIRYPAHGGEEHIGERYYTQDEVDVLVLNAHKRGLQVAIHCLGTWSIDQALNAFERAHKEHPRAEPRFRIEHFGFPTLSQIKRTKSMGVVSVVQPPFIFTGAEASKRKADELGGDVRVHPFKTMLSEGVTVAASSDCPCAPLEPLLGLYSMVTRRTRQAAEPVVPEEGVTPLEGLRMYTANAAYAMSRESEVGSLEVGKRADMVVLSHDPTAVDSDFIRDISVEQTYVDGQLLYER
ncbi:MAG: amidohydrolase [Chloroflexi bacterium]|nr:amidohydrolase [Chloroflexota bacterium]